MMRDSEKTIGNLIEHQKTAYLSSLDGDGFPDVRAMLAPRVREGIRVFYLTTNTSSEKVEQLRKNQKACLYFCDRRFFRGVTLKGTVEICEDPETKELIWEPGDTMYYKEGVTDPDYCVIKFTAFSGKYYAGFQVEEFSIEG